MITFRDYLTEAVKLDEATDLYGKISAIHLKGTVYHGNGAHHREIMYKMRKRGIARDADFENPDAFGYYSKKNKSFHPEEGGKAIHDSPVVETHPDTSMSDKQFFDKIREATDPNTGDVSAIRLRNGKLYHADGQDHSVIIDHLMMHGIADEDDMGDPRTHYGYFNRKHNLFDKGWVEQNQTSNSYEKVLPHRVFSINHIRK